MTARPAPRRALVAAVVLVMLVVGFFAARRAFRPPRAQIRPPMAEVPEPVIVRHTEAVRTTNRGAAVLGINEGISYPVDGLARLTGQGEGTLGRRAAMVRTVGARLVRVNSHTWPNLAFSEWKGDWSAADQLLEITGRSGLDAVLVIGPWPGARTALYTDRYVPDDLAAYEAWVESVVERYDGDGIDDMPGLPRPVLAWEVDNEPDQHNRVAPRGEDGEAPERTRDFETPEEYARVLVATSRAIRRADPEALVLSGGIYASAMPAGRRYLEAVLAEPGARQAIDGLSLHCYFMADNLDAVQRTMRMARALAPDLPVWITETSVPAVGPQPWIDEVWQAERVAGVIGGFLAEGADRIFWHTLADAPNEREGPIGYATNSLFRGVPDGNTVRYELKPAGEVFRRVAGHLEGQDPESFVEVPAEGGRLLETDDGWLAFDGEPAVPSGAGAVEDLMTGEVEVRAERVVAPAWISR